MTTTTTFDKFDELEGRINRTVDLVKTTRQEKPAAERDLAVARSQIKMLERELEQLKQERDLIKNKVESMLDTLSELTEETVV